MIKEYSLKKDGDTSLSKNFKVKEFRCKDGSDTILIDDLLIKVLQKLRDKVAQPIIINSAYRTETYNAKCGGAKSSYHLKGMASDIQCKNIQPITLARECEKMGILGIGLYNTFIHIDTRSSRYYWTNINGSNAQTNSFI